MIYIVLHINIVNNHHDYLATFSSHFPIRRPEKSLEKLVSFSLILHNCEWWSWNLSLTHMVPVFYLDNVRKRRFSTATLFWLLKLLSPLFCYWWIPEIWHRKKWDIRSCLFHFLTRLICSCPVCVWVEQHWTLLYA